MKKESFSKLKYNIYIIKRDYFSYEENVIVFTGS